MTVCSRRAPMFSARSLTIAAKSAMRPIAPSVKRIVTPSVESSAVYCLTSALFGSVRMRTKSSRPSASSSTRIGKRPCSSGIRSRRLRDVERAGGDEEDVIRLHHAVLRVDRRPFDDRQDVALHAFAADVRAVAALAAGDLVDLVDEDDPRLLHAIDRRAGDGVHVDQLLFLFLRQRLERFGHASASASSCAPGRGPAACP